MGERPEWVACRRPSVDDGLRVRVRSAIADAVYAARSAVENRAWVEGIDDATDAVLAELNGEDGKR